MVASAAAKPEDRALPSTPQPPVTAATRQLSANGFSVIGDA